MTENIIIKPSVQKRFDSFMAHGRVLFSARPAALERSCWRTRCCADKSNAEIAQIMDVKLPTVKTHASHILDKLDVKRQAEAKTAAKKLRLIPDDL